MVGGPGGPGGPGGYDLGVLIPCLASEAFNLFFEQYESPEKTFLTK